MSSPDGLSSQLTDEAPCTKNRLGQVGPGTEENHWSQMANSVASVWMTGSCRGVSKHFITSPHSAFVGRRGAPGVTISVVVVA